MGGWLWLWWWGWVWWVVGAKADVKMGVVGEQSRAEKEI